MFYVVSQMSDMILMRPDSNEYISAVKESFISILGCILLEDVTPVLDKKFDDIQVLKIR